MIFLAIIIIVARISGIAIGTMAGIGLVIFIHVNHTILVLTY